MAQLGKRAKGSKGISVPGLDWTKLGRAAAVYLNGTPRIDFMLGPLSREKRQRTAREKTKRTVDPLTRPDEVGNDGSKAKKDSAFEQRVNAQQDHLKRQEYISSSGRKKA